MDTAREVARNPLTRPTEKEQWNNSALSLTDELCAAKRKSGIQPPTYPNVILWSDASTIGLGAVFEGPLETQVISAPMAGITPQRMCTAELLAGLTGALHCREKLKSNLALSDLNWRWEKFSLKVTQKMELFNLNAHTFYSPVSPR